MLREKGIEFFPGGFFPAGAWTLGRYHVMRIGTPWLAMNSLHWRMVYWP